MPPFNLVIAWRRAAGLRLSSSTWPGAARYEDFRTLGVIYSLVLISRGAGQPDCGCHPTLGPAPRDMRILRVWVSFIFWSSYRAAPGIVVVVVTSMLARRRAI